MNFRLLFELKKKNTEVFLKTKKVCTYKEYQVNYLQL